MADTILVEDTMSEGVSENAVPEKQETREEMLSRHRKETNDLQNKEVALKKAAAKGSKAEQKAKKKQVDEEVSRLSTKLREAQAKELASLGYNGNTDKQKGDIDNLVNAIAGVSVTNQAEQSTKPNKHAKKREKRAQEEAARERRIQEEQSQIVNDRIIEDETLERKLKPLGFTINEIKADGHCLYRAVEDQLALRSGGSSPCTYQELREMVADYMRKNTSDFLPFFHSENAADGESADSITERFEKYCRDIESTAAWGGQLELGALTHCLKKHIMIYSGSFPDVEMGKEYNQSNGTGSSSKSSIMLSFHSHAFGLATQGIKRKWDLSATRQIKKFERSPAPIVDPSKSPLVTPSASHSRRGTRSSVRLCGKSSKTVPSKTTEYVTLEDDLGSPSFSHDVSGDISATEPDEHIRSASLLSSQPLREIHIQGQTGGHGDDCSMADSSPQGLLARRANVTLVDEDIDFDFDFLYPGSSDTTLVSYIPSGLELATAKASLRHFRNMNLAALGPIEKATILSAASILKNSPDFAHSTTSGVLDGLPAMFSAFHDSSATCLETLIHLGNFKAQKEKLDGLVEERKAAIATLHQKNQEFDLKEDLVKKLEAELAQHRSDMLVLLHDSEALKASSDRLRLDIQHLGGTLVNQKQSYQQWEDTLKKVEVIRADCYSSWEDLRHLDL